MGGPIDLEWLALAEGLKPALRIAIEPAHRASLAPRAARIGASVVEAGRLATIGTRTQSVLYVSRDPMRAAALRDAEAPVLPGGPSVRPDEGVLDAHRRTGTLLGYPACCVEGFVARVARGVTSRERGGDASEEFVAIEAAAMRSACCDARLNVLRRRDAGALIAFHPCRLDCPAAIALASPLLDALAARDRPAAAALSAALATPIAIALDGTLHLGGAAPAGTLALAFAWPQRAF